METQIRTLGSLNIAVGIFSGLLAVFNLFFFGGPLTIASYFSVHAVVATVWIGAALALTVPSVIVGFGLLGFRGWARGSGIVLSIVQMINVPLGTIVGLYGLFVLFSEGADMIFNRRFGQYMTGRR